MALKHKVPDPDLNYAGSLRNFQEIGFRRSIWAVPNRHIYNRLKVNLIVRLRLYNPGQRGEIFRTFRVEDLTPIYGVAWHVHEKAQRFFPAFKVKWLN